MTDPKDRRAALLASTSLNGIDFVEIANPNQETLRVHFLNPVAVQGTLTAPPAITGGDAIRSVAVNPVDDATNWSLDAAGRPVLTLTVDDPGDFSFYTLTLHSPALDQFFTGTQFTFKALCPSNLDCAPPPLVCPALPDEMPPIDYLAKDFLSFRQALLDFSALRYPEWRERSEADFGVMFLEALSGLADDLSYSQDRVSAEAVLDTATQRRSLVRLARLVDYEPRPATAARVLLQLDVLAGPLPAGLRFSAPSPEGGTIDFELGLGLRDMTAYVVAPIWNRGIQPYFWDDSQRCLAAGATEMWVQGHGFGFSAGQSLLIDTDPLTSGDPPIREVVRLVSASEELDPLFPGPPDPPTPVTHLTWGPEDALTLDHDLTRTTLAGNLIPATQGRRISETFAVETPPAAAPQMPTTLFRLGPNTTPDFETAQYLFTLREAPLAWLAPEDPDPALDESATWPLPEILLNRQPVPPATQPVEWPWCRRLLDAEPFEQAFTVDPARYRFVARNSDLTFSLDYVDDQGETIRFGDGVFGEAPDPGVVFDVTYRTGGGAAGNVAADSITGVQPGAGGMVSRVTNPFPAQGGADMESDEQVRRRAPFAFRARQFFVVRREDYIAAAESLAWVQRAGSVFRWTGSWLTVFTTADPKGSEALAVSPHTQLINLLNRRRLAGYESYVPAPRYVSLDLRITVCARPDAFRGDVEAALLEALGDTQAADGTLGFFHPDLWTFGAPLERSRLAAALQAAYGVAGVVSIQYRQRGVTPAFVAMPDTVAVKTDEILRVDNDPSRPERGSIKLVVEGGK